MNNLGVEMNIEVCDKHSTNPTRFEWFNTDHSYALRSKQEQIIRNSKKEKECTCRQCFKKFETRKELCDHRKIHDAEKFTDKHTFRYDENLRIFVCNTCSAEFQKKEDVEVHIWKIHEVYTCEVCQQVFTTVYNFALHMKQHSEGETLSCPLCEYTTTRPSHLQTHINRVHYHKFFYHCTTCGKGFNDHTFFKEHKNEHLGIKAFVCVVCNKKFMFSRYLNLHQTRYHTVHIEGTLHKNQCGICLQMFSKKLTLEKHIISKHSANPEPLQRHLCDICGTSFAARYKLKIHYRIHTGEKPYSCSYCNKAFAKRDYVVFHERVHTGERPFSCKYCDKSFNQPAPLKIHVRKHTGERPYICQLCNGGYVSRSTLKMHQQICTGSSTD